MKFSKYNLLIPNTEEGRYYLFNVFNGSCLDIGEIAANCIRNDEIDELDEKTTDLFKGTGVILPSNIDPYVLG